MGNLTSCVVVIVHTKLPDGSLHLGVLASGKHYQISKMTKTSRCLIGATDATNHGFCLVMPLTTPGYIYFVLLQRCHA